MEINTRGLDYIFKEYVDTARANGVEINEDQCAELADSFNAEIRECFFGEENQGKEMNVLSFYQGMQEALGADNKEALDAMAEAMIEMSGLDGNGNTITFNDLFGDATSYYSEDIQALVAQQRQEEAAALAQAQAETTQVVAQQPVQQQTPVYGSQPASSTPAQSTTSESAVAEDATSDWKYSFPQDSDLGKALQNGVETDEFTNGPPNADFMDKDGNYYDKDGNRINLRENDYDLYHNYKDARTRYESLMSMDNFRAIDQRDAAKADLIEAIKADIQYRGEVQSTRTVDGGRTQIREFADGTKAYYGKDSNGNWTPTTEYYPVWG